VDSLHDRFRLLNGGRRTAVRRQQTLRASVDWSHALLTEPERVLFRRLAPFLGGFDLAAARAVAGDSEVERYQVLDQLTLLVDKSLVIAENVCGRTRYRVLETVRQYALEKLGESGEADAVRARHRDHYTAMAALLDAPAATGHQQRVQQIEAEIDNLRVAFAWSRETMTWTLLCSSRRRCSRCGSPAAVALVRLRAHASAITIPLPVTGFGRDPGCGRAERRARVVVWAGRVGMCHRRALRPRDASHRHP
jgi:predicted ATPase